LCFCELSRSGRQRLNNFGVRPPRLFLCGHFLAGPPYSSMLFPHTCHLWVVSTPRVQSEPFIRLVRLSCSPPPPEKPRRTPRLGLARPSLFLFHRTWGVPFLQTCPRCLISSLPFSPPCQQSAVFFPKFFPLLLLIPLSPGQFFLLPALAGILFHFRFPFPPPLFSVQRPGHLGPWGWNNVVLTTGLAS